MNWKTRYGVGGGGGSSDAAAVAANVTVQRTIRTLERFAIINVMWKCAERENGKQTDK